MIPDIKKKLYIYIIISLLPFSSIYYIKQNSNADIIKKINFCFNIEKNVELSVSCVEDLYKATLNDGSFINLYTYLQEIATEEKSMKNFYICHRAAHNTGGKIVEHLGGVKNSINLLNKPACGLVHAPYDYFGREKHSFSTWVALVKECSKLQSKLDYYIQCDDAVGHSIVQSISKYKEFYNDNYFSYKLCATFEKKEAQINCSEAIVMERFGPLGPNVKPETLIPPENLVAQCLAIPSSIIYAKEGCSYGVGWYLTMLYLDELKLSSRNNDFTDLFFKVEKDCSLLKSPLNKLCFDRFKNLVN